MSIPRKLLVWFSFVLSFLFLSFDGFADLGDQPIHFSGDRQLWDRKANRVELFGHAAVSQQGETLTANYIRLDMNSRILDAVGDCVYLTTESSIYGDEMHFNLDTRTGTIIGGRVSNDRFTVRGERINKLGDGRFQTHWGNYTPCHDCAPSWSLLGEDVDIQMNNYAFISNMIVQIKDTPSFWLPYMVMPVKNRRQTGVLFPPLSFGSPHGTIVVLPFFWAISDSADVTLGLGQYTARGWRFEGEGRYLLSGRSGGRLNYYYTRDTKTLAAAPHRWGLNVFQTQELPYQVEEKLRVLEVADNTYPFLFPTDIRAPGEAFLPSSLVFSRSTPDFSAFLGFQRYRNLLNSNPNLEARVTEFDPHTVQTLPTVVATTNDQPFWQSSILGGATVGVTNFTRSAGPFDFDQSHVPFGTAPPAGLQAVPGVDPIREATRVAFTPSVYTTLRPLDVVSVIPSLQYRGFYYDFHGNMKNLNRGYLLFQTDLSTQLEKIYEFPDDENIPKAKHLIRPLLTYSYIPSFAVTEDTNHPFLSQIRYAQNTGVYGYNFDNNDIVPITFSQNSANYFVPLGNSLAYGFTTQWIRRRGALTVEMPSYQNAVEFNAGQAINFLEINNQDRPAGQSPQILTRFFSRLALNFDKLGSTTNYFYYPDVAPETPRHTISTGLSYVFERSMHQRLLTYDRSVSLGYTFNKITAPTSNLTGTLNFSLNDYLMPFGSLSYTFVPTGKLIGGALGLQVQSASQCWKAMGGVNYFIGPDGKGFFNPVVDFSLNLTGSGFGGVTELATQAMTH